MEAVLVGDRPTHRTRRYAGTLAEGPGEGMNDSSNSSVLDVEGMSTGYDDRCGRKGTVDTLGIRWVVAGLVVLAVAIVLVLIFGGGGSGGGTGGGGY